MANVSQIYSIVNEASKQALGREAITVKDVTSFIALGNQILSSDTNKDAFYQSLADRIGRVYVKYKAYKINKDSKIFKTPLQFGMALEKVQTMELAKSNTNKSWDTNPNPYADGSDHTDITVQIFAKRGVFEIDKVIYDYQLETAFTDPVKMGSFVELVFNDMYNAMENDMHTLGKLCVATAMATCLANVSTAPTCARNLLAEYNANHTTNTLTVAEAMESVQFLKFASREINLTVKRMKEMSSLFNTAHADRFTDRDDIVVRILSDFSSATDSYLQSDTYHKELTSLPMYEDVTSWQASGTSYNFDDTSKINIKTTGDDAITVNQSGIIAFVSDIEKCGVMYDRIRTKSMYNAIGERTHYAHKADKGWYVDETENGVVFYIAE